MIPWFGAVDRDEAPNEVACVLAFIHARASVTPRLWPTMSTCFACVYFSTARTNASRSGTFATVECAAPERFVGSTSASHWSPW